MSKTMNRESGLMARQPQNSRVMAGVARSAGSPCRMEGLEPRLLLANELVIGIGDVVFRDGPQLPDDKIEVPVTIQNLSAAPISGKIRIQIWASPDDALGDNDDFLCFEGNLNISPRANEIQTKKVKARLPLDILPITYNFIVTVIDESMLPGGASFDVPEAVDDEILGVRWQFGQVDGRSGNTTLKFMNNSGVVYKVNFSDGFDGSELGEVESFYTLIRDERGAPPGDQVINLQFEDTDFDDRISVRRTGGPSDPDLFYLTQISAFGTRVSSDHLGFFDASGLTLYGSASFAGLHKLYLGNVLDAGIVGINNLPFRGDDMMEFNDRVSIKVRNVVGTFFNINGTLANMQADSFNGLNVPSRGGDLGGIGANIIEKVNIKNEFTGAVEAFGYGGLRGHSDDSLRVVDAFIVGGHLRGVFLAFGGVAKIQAASIDDFEAAILGRLERLIVKGDVGSDPMRGEQTLIIGARDISRIDIDGHLFDTQIFAGLVAPNNLPRGISGFSFGSLYEGNVANATYTTGSIGRVNIKGDMDFSEIAAGVDPNTPPLRWPPLTSFADGTLVGDSSVSKIGPVKVGGTLEDSRFVSGDFPDNVNINGSTYSTVTNPDGYFVVVFPPV